MTSSIEAIEFEGMPALRLEAAGASAVVSLFGGQVLSWSPSGGKEWLYLSEQAVFDGNTPIRGGVPVCFPQFSNHGPLPRHGFARTLNWQVANQRTGDNFALVVLRVDDNEHTRALWPHAFGLELTVAIEDNRLDIELEVDNTGTEDFNFTAALHTYLRVKEVEQAPLEGLYGLSYQDSTDARTIRRETGEHVLVDTEIDRIYLQARRPLLLRDRGRSLGIHGDGFPDVVVWNPWETRCAEIADLPSNGFRHLLCVEAAAVDTPVLLKPGSQWWGRQTLLEL